MWDVIIVGGGVAGSSAALVLGRSRRRVLVCDSEAPRNGMAQALHGFLTRDGIDPLEFRRLARKDLDNYPSVSLLAAEVQDAVAQGTHFLVTLTEGNRLESRKLLLATGVVDIVPPVEGIQEFYGRTVFHCPYCDGWEVRGQLLAAYGQGEEGYDLALELTGWSSRVLLCSDGPAGLEGAQLKKLSRLGIPVYEQRILRLEGQDGQLERIRLEDGTCLSPRALFYPVRWRQRSDLAARLGCHLDDNGLVKTRSDGTTNVPGVFVAGDASDGLQLVAVATSEGARAAVAMNKKLILEDLAARPIRRSHPSTHQASSEGLAGARGEDRLTSPGG